MNFSFSPRKYPLGATRFLKENRLGGNLYNHYDFGNLLLFELFPQNLVFIDGRVDLYGAEIVNLYLGVFHARPGWERELAERQVEICVLKTVGEPNQGLLRALHEAREWALVFWDDISAVYVKRTAGREGFLAGHYVYSVRPDEVDDELMGTPRGLAAAKRDYAHKVEEDPACVPALKGLADAAALEGDREGAIRIMRTALEFAPESADLHYNLGAALLEADRLDEAETRFRRVLRLGAYRGEAWKSLGAIAFRRGRLDEAVRCMRKAVGLQPADWQLWWNLSMLYERRGEVSAAIAAAVRALALDPQNAQAKERIAALRQREGARP